MPPTSDISSLRLDGKIALIAGGTGALGGAITEGLMRAGATCAITGTTDDRASNAASKLGKPGEVRSYGMNATDLANVEAVRDAVLSDMGGLHILVNCVGGNTPKATTSESASFLDLDDDAFRHVMDLNFVYGTVRMCRVFGSAMTDDASIINISSMAADRPLTRVGGYSASKAAVNNFTQWLAVHFAQEGHANIRVNAIAPGFFLSEQNRYLLTEEKTGDLTPRGQSIVDHTPAARFGQPSDLASTAVWLASDASRFVNGSIIPVDGGFSAFSGV